MGSIIMFAPFRGNLEIDALPSLMGLDAFADPQTQR